MLPTPGIEPAGASRYPIGLGLLERPGSGVPGESAEIFYLHTDEIGADSTEVQLQRLAGRVPASAGCVVLDGERRLGKSALRFANVCAKPVWLRRGGDGDALYLPLARFDRLFPQAGAGVPQQAMRASKRVDHAFDRNTLRDIATGNLRPKVMGGYSLGDSDLLCSLISRHVGMLHIHDRDCPASFAQRLVDRTGKPAIVWHHYGRRLYVPRAAVARVLPLGNDVLGRLRTVESGAGSPLYDKVDAGVGLDSAVRILHGRLTSLELGDYSDGMAVALSVLIPPDLKEIRLLDLGSPDRFAWRLADAAGVPVRVGAKLFEPGGSGAAGVPHAALPALPAGPRVAALSREDKARLLFVRQGRLLKEDLQGYDTRCLPRLVAALDAGLRRVEVHDADCPPDFLHDLADAAGKPVLHGSLVYLPRAIDPRPMPNRSEMDMSDNARRARVAEQVRRERVTAGSIRSASVHDMAPDALAELAAVVDPQAHKPYVDADIDRETAQRLCNALGKMLRWGKERLQPDPQGHRWFDPSVLVPDDVGLIGWDDYRQHMENIAAHYAAQGVPVTLEYLAGEEGRPPALHLQIGKGRNHHLNTSTLHPNETHAWVADVHDAEWWCRNAYLLDEHDLSIHYYAFPPTVAKLNEPGLVGRPDPHAYAQHMVRSQVIAGHPSHGYPFEIEDFSFQSYDQGVLAFCALVEGILALGQRILSAHSGHNAHMGAVPIVFLLLGQQIERLAALAARLERMAADQGFKVLDIPPPESCQEPIDGARVSFLLARAAAQYAAGSPGGMTDIEYLEKRVLESGQASFVGMLAEVSKWTAARMFELTEGEVVHWKDRILGNLPALMREAGQVLARRVAEQPALRDDPVVEAALSVTGQAEEPVWGCNAPPPVAADPSTPVPPLEALCRIVVNPFHAATDAGQVVRALEHCGQTAGLAEDLNAQMHRVIDDVFRLGRVQDVPLEEGIRAFLKARSLLLQDALEHEQAVA